MDKALYISRSGNGKWVLSLAELTSRHINENGLHTTSAILTS